MAKVAIENGINTIQKPFNLIVAKEIVKHSKKINTATNVFAHMSSLGDVMDGVMELLDNDGFYNRKSQYDEYYKHNQ